MHPDMENKSEGVAHLLDSNIRVVEEEKKGHCTHNIPYSINTVNVILGAVSDSEAKLLE